METIAQVLHFLHPKLEVLHLIVSKFSFHGVGCERHEHFITEKGVIMVRERKHSDTFPKQKTVLSIINIIGKDNFFVQNIKNQLFIFPPNFEFLGVHSGPHYTLIAHFNQELQKAAIVAERVYHPSIFEIFLQDFFYLRESQLL